MEKPHQRRCGVTDVSQGGGWEAAFCFARVRESGRSREQFDSFFFFFRDLFTE